MRVSRSMVPEQLTKRLLKDENVVWWGYPAQGIMLTARDGFLIPFSLLWGGFAIFWETMALRDNAPLPVTLFGFAFVLIGLFMIFGRFLVDSWLRGHMVYALTDRRVLIARSGPWPSFQAVNLDRLPEVSLIEKSNGKGTIRFGQAAPRFGLSNRGGGSWITALDPTPQFLGIGDVQRVFAMVQERSQARIP